jgi:hypothetical protein
MPGAGSQFDNPANPIANVAAKTAGVAGGMMSPLNKFMLFQKGGMGAKALAGAAQGALYSPTENIGDMGQRALGGVAGGALGAAATPIGNALTRYAAPAAEKAGRAVAQAGKMYREMLRPNQGEIRKVELKLGKDLNKYYQIAAKEGLPIKEGADNTLDVREAIEVLKNKTTALEDKLQTELVKGGVRGGEKIKPKYDLDTVAAEVKKDLKNKYSGAKELELAEKHIDDIIEAEKRRHGDVVDASTLNTIKRGSWEKSYNILEPNNSDADRALGFFIKGRLEKDFPNVAKLNSTSGDFLNLVSLLRSAHGRKIQQGRLGQHFAGILGGGVGGAVGHALMPGVGTIGGAAIGQEVAKAGLKVAVSPERISSRASALAQKYNPNQSQNAFQNFLKKMQEPSLGLPKGKQMLGGALAVGGTLGAGQAQASEPIDMNRIYQIESSNNPKAYNKKSKAVGLGQITPIVLKEWNNFNKKDKLTTSDLYDSETNKKVSSWYMNKRIPQMLKALKIEDTTRNRLIAYNWGVGNIGKKLPKETEDYLKKYGAE